MASSINESFNKFYEHRAGVLGPRPQASTTKYALIKYLLNKKDTVLDIGCGRGEILLPLQKQGYCVIGLDSCKANTVLLKQSVCDDCTRPRDYYSVYNAFLVLDLLEHLTDEDIAGLMDNLSQSPKHKLVVCVPNREDVGRASVICPKCSVKFHPYGHLRAYDDESITKLLVSYGYEILHTYVVPNFLNVKSLFVPLFMYRMLCAFNWYNKGNIIVEARKK